jgi:hypothetical protein
LQLNFTKFCWRSCFIGFEALLALLILIVLAACVLTWRLTSAPLEVEFARGAIESALRDEARGVSVALDRVVVHWPDLRGPILLGIGGVSVLDMDGNMLLAVEEAAIGIKKRSLLLGQVRPLELVLKDLSLHVIRRKNNSIDVGLDIIGPPLPPSMQPVDDTSIIEDIISALADDQVSSDGSPLSSLEIFEIEDARVVVDDRVLGMSWSLPRSGAVFSRAPDGLRASIEVQLPSKSMSEISEPPRLAGELLLNTKSGDVDVDLILEHFSPVLLADKIPDLKVLGAQNILLHGRLKAVLDGKLSVKESELALVSDVGSVDIAEFSREPVLYKDFGVLIQYDRAEGSLSMPKAKLTLQDVTFEVGADLVVSDEGVSGPVRIDIDAVSHQDLAALWPVALEGDNSEEWIVTKPSKGMFSDVFAQGDLVLTKDEQGAWDADVVKVLAGFAFEGMDVDYRAPLWPVTNAKGVGRFDLDAQKLSVDVERASLRGLSVSSATLSFVDIIDSGKGKADIKVALSGPVKEALAYVAVEPIEVKPDFDVQSAKGRAELDVHVSFPTLADLPKDLVKVDVRGTMHDLSIANVVKGMPLSGGPFKVTVDSEAFEVSGKGALDGRAVDLSYREFLSSEGKAYSSKVKAKMNADQAFREKFGVDLITLMEGPAFVDVEYTMFNGGRSEAVVSADLTASRVYVEPFDYVKDAGKGAKANLRAVLQNEVLKQVQDLTVTGPAFKLEKTLLSFRGSGENTELSGGNVSRFVLGETIAGVEFEVEKSGLVKLVLEGAFLDARPFLGDDEHQKTPYDGPPMQVSVAVDGMRTADGQTVQYGKVYVDLDDMGKFNQLEMDAIAGKGDVYLRYKPDETGKRVFRFEADDAGATLTAFDLYTGMRGGKLRFYGEPVGGRLLDRNLKGHAEIRDFKVVDAPALAKLLSAMSLPGLLQNLGTDGLSFTKMEADFSWLYRSEGSLLVLKNGRTSGNSLGLTFDGTFDNAVQSLDVTGTIIPLAGVNKAIGSIPLIGDVLTGGTGALIAATYKMKGRGGKDPEVSVNPLSVLTPGILRRILFEEN